MASTNTSFLLANAVERLCDRRGLTFAWLAGQMNWQCTNSGEFEAMALALTLDDVDRLCDLLEVEPSELFSK